MGRHSSARQLYFYKSVALYFLPWALVAAIAVTAVWAGVSALGQDELSTRPPPPRKETRKEGPADSKKIAAAPTQSPETPAATPSPTSPSPTASATTSPSPTEDDGSKTPLITDVTVQVLNGTSASAADDAVATRLSDLGFDVVAVQPASTSYPETTVYWSTVDSKDAAEALGERFGWQIGRKPENLSPSVAIHVVVGADEA